MRFLFLPLALGGCLNPPFERPRYAEVLWNPAIDVAFDADGRLWVLSYADGGGLAIGSVDVHGRDRAVDATPILRDGAALDTAFGNGGQNLADWFSLVVHPGTGTPWLYHRGAVGPIVDGSFDPQIDVGADAGGARGTLAFFDADTLLVSAERIDQSDERTDAVPVVGDVADASAAAPFSVVTVDGETQTLWGVCDLDVLDGNLYLKQCGGGTNLFRTDAPVVQDREAASGGRSEISPVSNDFVAVSAFGAVATGDQAGGKYCAEPWGDDAHTEVVSRGSYALEGLCRGSDANVPDPARAALSPDGDTWAAVYDNAAVVLFDKQKPRDAQKDVEGTWCATSTVGGVTESFTLGEGGLLTFSNPGTEILHAELSWSRKGDDVIHVDYRGFTTYETEDASFDHWAVRVGDTLHIKSTTDGDSYDYLTGAGYKTLTGLWVPCPT